MKNNSSNHYPASGKANLLAEIDECLELLNDIFERSEPTGHSFASLQRVMPPLVGHMDIPMTNTSMGHLWRR